ncbi:MAG: hypothetical protein AB3N14_15765 [Flavobacteriaceae bacterium]
MLIQQGTLPFTSHSGTGPQKEEQTVNFPRPANNVVALLSGFEVEFVDDERPLHLMEIDLNTRNLSNQAIEITGSLGLRDRSNVWDDTYRGHIRYAVIGSEANSELLGGTLLFPSQDGAGPFTLSENIQYAERIEASASLLTGFKARYSTDDENLLELQVDLNSQMPSTNQMQISGAYGLRDNSGNWDNRYDGTIHYSGIGIRRSIDPGGNTPQIRTGSIEFDFHSGSGPREESMRISFDRPIGNCIAALTGFLVGFDSSDDHPVHKVIINVEARKMSNTEVEVVGSLGLRDNSNHWDDRYRGSIRFAVIAE